MFSEYHKRHKEGKWSTWASSEVWSLETAATVLSTLWMQSICYECLLEQGLVLEAEETPAQKHFDAGLQACSLGHAHWEENKRYRVVHLSCCSKGEPQTGLPLENRNSFLSLEVGSPRWRWGHLESGEGLLCYSPTLLRAENAFWMPQERPWLH